MYFTDPAFFIFLLIVVPLYWCLPFRAQNILLLVASYIFYGFVHPWISILLLAMSLINYVAALLFEDFPRYKKLVLVSSIVLSLGILAWFKYAMFVVENVAWVLGLDSPALRIMLPAGISFHTFQAIACTVDAYRGELKVKRSLINYLLFISFYPQLVAGPIERSGNLLRQVSEPRKWSPGQFVRGLDLLILGYLKKMVISDNVALYVNMIFDLKDPSILMVACGAFGFGIQILADFSAYTDIARGCSRLMGFEIMENFNHPYIAKNPSDFWRRWHISLSNWIRDYIYFPLGGSQVSTRRWIFNIVVVWFLCGLWHGAAWNYIVWGLYWGALIILYRFSPKLPQGKFLDVGRILLMNCWIALGWLFFRVHDLRIIGDYFSLKTLRTWHQIDAVLLALSIIFIFYASPLLLGFSFKRPIAKLLEGSNTAIATRIFGYTILLLLIVLFAADNPEEFLYFQF